MNESFIIITSIIIITLAGAYFVYKLGQYLYEVYVEHFTTDPDPDAPERPQTSTWMEALGEVWEKHDEVIKVIGSITYNVLDTILKAQQARGHKKIHKTYGYASRDSQKKQREKLFTDPTQHGYDSHSGIYKGKDNQWHSERPPLRFYSKDRLPKQGKDRELAMEHMYPEDDTWDTSRVTKETREQVDKMVEDMWTTKSRKW